MQREKQNCDCVCSASYTATRLCVLEMLKSEEMHANRPLLPAHVTPGPAG